MANNTLRQLNNLSAQIETDYQIRFEEVEQNDVWFPQLSFQKTADGRSITQQWVHDHAQITETQWGQPPVYHQMDGEYAVIPLKYYHNALNIDAMDLSEDSTGEYSKRAADIGARAAKFPQDLAADALARGDTSNDFLIYDGQRIFANAHPKADGSTFDNLLAGVFDSTNFAAVRTAMQRFTDDRGRPYGAKPNYVIGPPDLEVAFGEVLNNTWAPDTTASVDNLQKGLAQSIIDQQLADTNDWYVATTELSVNPFIEIRHKEFGNFDLHAEIDNDSPAFRDHKQRRWWIFAAMTVFPTRPETMIKVVN